MAHEIETMAFNGATPWHKLGTKVEECDLYNWPAFCIKAGLDWTADLVPLCTLDKGQLSDHCAVRRSSDNKILGTVGPDFRPLQNAEAFKWFEPFLESQEAQLHTAGSLRGGTRVWVLAKLNRTPLVIVPGDEVEKYILLSHGHDGSMSCRAGFTPIRVVCANTLAMAHGADASKLIRVKHTQNVVANLEAIRAVMDLANQQFEATAEQFRQLARRSINQADLRKYVRKVLGVADDETPSTRTANQIEAIIGLAESGRGNDFSTVRGTWWTAYNGVTEWLGLARGNNPDSRLNSLWFGDSATMNRNALELALQMAS